MADKGWGSKTSSSNNYYKFLKDSVLNVVDTNRKGGYYSLHWKDAKKKK